MKGPYQKAKKQFGGKIIQTTLADGEKHKIKGQNDFKKEKHMFKLLWLMG